jgi:hypothetical protein
VHLPVSGDFGCERVEGITEPSFRALHVKNITAVSWSACPETIFENFVACREDLEGEKPSYTLQNVCTF